MSNEHPHLSGAEAHAALPPIFVVYRHPTDYPLGFVVRVWRGLRADADAHRCGSLAEARAYIERVHPGAVRMDRAHGDAEVIEEAWI